MRVTYLLAFLFDTVLLATAVYAVVRGRTPERIGGALNVIGTVLSSVLRSPSAHRWETIEVRTFGIDCLMAIGFYLLAVRTARYWPIWCFGFALANVFVHPARAFLPDVGWTAYSGLSILWAYLALAALAFGTRYEGRYEWRRETAAGPRERK